jgi:quinoprotein glucose dehydrogenase
MKIKNILIGLFALSLFACQQKNGKDEETLEWREYAADKFSSKYSPASKINASNIKELKTAWTWESVDQPYLDADTMLYTWRNESTPIMVGGVLYTSTSLSQVVAIDAETGKTIWIFDPETRKNGSPTNLGFVHRGVAYWEKDEKKRIFIGTGDAFLISIDAATGKVDNNFGTNGRIDLTLGLSRPVKRIYYGVTSPPLVCNGKVIVGSSIRDQPMEKIMPPGDVRAYDVETGNLAWTFEAIPKDTVLRNKTWLDQSWKTTGNMNVWAWMSCDEELGYVYLPFSTASNDFYGGERPGDNLYSQSIVAVNVATGEKVWHYQVEHHGIWDYDLPAAPNLLNITVNGKPIKALAQISKQAFTYVLDRVTGKPVWPIEERNVPPSKVPGEVTASTQPHPTIPAPFDRQGVTENDLIDFTPELKRMAIASLQNYTYGPLYSPPSEKGTIGLPGVVGGASWAGAAVDPVKAIMYIPSVTSPITFKVWKDATIPYTYRGRYFFNVAGPLGLPLFKPPYSRITAIDMNTGKHLWVAAMGKGPVDHPQLKDLHLPDLGGGKRNFILLTPTLLFAANEGQGAGRPSHFDNSVQLNTKTLEPMLRAFDPATGKLVAEIELPDNVGGAMMTYVWKGKQYIVMPIGGASQKARLLAMSVQ